MISISFSQNKAFVWNAKDWLKLREEHRIIGQLIGCLPSLPYQEEMKGLPMTLLSEETALLLEKKIATLINFPALKQKPDNITKQKYIRYQERISEKQIQLSLDKRKQQIEGMLDQIVEGKKRKLKKEAEKGEDHDTTGNVEIDRNKVFDEEVAKIVPMTSDNILVQTFTEYPWIERGETKSVEWKFPSTPLEKLHYMIYKDLWEKGYYITVGHKFGGDFLVYPGDPVKFHAKFLVICIENESEIPLTELVALGRLGTSVRKTILLASVSKKESTVVYQSLQWNGCLSDK